MDNKKELETLKKVVELLDTFEDDREVLERILRTIFVWYGVDKP